MDHPARCSRGISQEYTQSPLKTTTTIRKMPIRIGKKQLRRMDFQSVRPRQMDRKWRRILMAEKNYTPHQQKIIKRYYENMDGIQWQRLADLVGELYLAEGKKKDRLWKSA